LADVESESQFTEIVSGNDFALVMFYAPVKKNEEKKKSFFFFFFLCSHFPSSVQWCGHCKSFKPAFAAAATKVGEQTSQNPILRFLFSAGKGQVCAGQGRKEQKNVGF
jgi:hypothetical protein